MKQNEIWLINPDPTVGAELKKKLLEAISKVKNLNTEVQRFGVTQRE